MTRPDPFYWSKVWRALRAAMLRRYPMCQTPGCVSVAQEVDHILQRSRGGAPFDPRNLRCLCKSCHSQRRQGGEPRAKGCDALGNPRDATHWWHQPARNLSESWADSRPGGQERVSFPSGEDAVDG